MGMAQSRAELCLLYRAKKCNFSRGPKISCFGQNDVFFRIRRDQRTRFFSTFLLHVRFTTFSNHENACFLKPWGSDSFFPTTLTLKIVSANFAVINRLIFPNYAYFKIVSANFAMINRVTCSSEIPSCCWGAAVGDGELLLGLCMETRLCSGPAAEPRMKTLCEQYIRVLSNSVLKDVVGRREEMRCMSKEFRTRRDGVRAVQNNAVLFKELSDNTLERAQA
jgi:hypothetical protein